MDWVNDLGKERSMLALLQEFEKQFAQLSALDRTFLHTSRFPLFVKSVNALDRESVGPLLETEEGLMDDWAVIKGVCSRFGKWREWRDKGLLTAGATVGRKLEEPTLAETEET